MSAVTYSKRGLSGPLSSQDVVLFGGTIAWCHNWTAFRLVSAAVDAEIVPMAQWKRGTNDVLREYARTHPNATWLIGNEPQMPDQDSLSAARAAGSYRERAEMILGIAPKSRFVIGGFLIAHDWRVDPNSCYVPDDPRTFEAGPGYWITFWEASRKFWESLDDRFLGWHIHVYYRDWEEPPYELRWFRRAVLSFYAWMRKATPRKQLWVTEWGCLKWRFDDTTDAPGYPRDYIRRCMAWMDTRPWIQRYAWFIGRGGTDETRGASFALIRNGKLTSLGEVYANG